MSAWVRGRKERRRRMDGEITKAKEREVLGHKKRGIGSSAFSALLRVFLETSKRDLNSFSRRRLMEEAEEEDQVP
ncbi:unnamed protein product [Musa banksii]